MGPSGSCRRFQFLLGYAGVLRVVRQAFWFDVRRCSRRAGAFHSHPQRPGHRSGRSEGGCPDRPRPPWENEVLSLPAARNRDRPSPDRSLFAFELTNEAAFARSLAKCMEGSDAESYDIGDSDDEGLVTFRKRTVAGHTVYQFHRIYEFDRCTGRPVSKPGPQPSQALPSIAVPAATGTSAPAAATHPHRKRCVVGGRQGLFLLGQRCRTAGALAGVGQSAGEGPALCADTRRVGSPDGRPGELSLLRALRRRLPFAGPRRIRRTRTRHSSSRPGQSPLRLGPRARDGGRSHGTARCRGTRRSVCPNAGRRLVDRRFRGEVGGREVTVTHRPTNLSDPTPARGLSIYLAPAGLAPAERRIGN